MVTAEQLQKVLGQHPEISNFWIAYSGGLDSHVLLHSFYSLFKGSEKPKIQVVHINHGLSPKAKKWEQHCQDVCDAMHLPYKCFTVDATASEGESPEASARAARYTVFSNLIGPHDCLFTAHHQDDQAETIVLQLLRGAGVKGLSAMPVVSAFSLGFHCRPLLGVTHSDMKAYAVENKLQWVDDESNFDTSFSRNYLRHKVLPIIKDKWPGFAKTLSRSASHCAEAQSILQDVAMTDLDNVRGSVEKSISIKALSTLSDSRKNNVIRHFIASLGLPLPSDIKLQQVLQELLLSRIDATPIVEWEGAEVRRFQDDIYFMQPLAEVDNEVVLSWDDLSEPLLLPGTLGIVQAKQDKAGIVIPKSANIKVTFRHGGERCHPVGRNGSHPLKKLFQEWQVAPWQRNSIPLVYCNDVLIAVVGYCITEQAQGSGATKGWHFTLV